MGIINLTPDSFFAASRRSSTDMVLTAAEAMLEQGADFLDLGAVSTRPGAQIPDAKAESERLIPALTALLKRFPEALVSVDSFRSEIVTTAAQHGAFMINDISGGTFDPLMVPTIGKLNIPYVLMHTTDVPEKMQLNALQSKDLGTVKDFFAAQTSLFRQAGATQLILDPGFGFGKTLEANYALLNQLAEIAPDEYPLLAGISRKSMIYKLLQTTPDAALNGTSVLHTVAILKGTSVLRVHDVKEARETIRLLQFLHDNQL